MNSKVEAKVDYETTSLCRSISEHNCDACGLRSEQVCFALQVFFLLHIILSSLVMASLAIKANCIVPSIACHVAYAVPSNSLSVFMYRKRELELCLHMGKKSIQ
uniref:Uncharacterized protein n=1 Tax=Glossina pallidipes TaxID=7398 RepID=A0A1B0A0V1_GLOPL